MNQTSDINFIFIIFIFTLCSSYLNRDVAIRNWVTLAEHNVFQNKSSLVVIVNKILSRFDGSTFAFCSRFKLEFPLNCRVKIQAVRAGNGLTSESPLYLPYICSTTHNESTQPYRNRDSNIRSFLPCHRECLYNDDPAKDYTI